MNPFRWSFRAQMLSGAAVCFALIGFAIYSQLAWGLVPCPLCVFQRIAFAALGLVFLLAGLHAPQLKAVQQAGQSAGQFSLQPANFAIRL